MSLGKLWDHIEGVSGPRGIEPFVVRSLSATRLFVWPGPNERIYDIHRFLVTVERQGCSYTACPIDLTLFKSYLNAAIPALKEAPEFVQIAALDAVMPSLPTMAEPLEVVHSHKPVWEKSLWRADTVVRHTKQLLATSEHPKNTIAIIGYSDAIARKLMNTGFEVDIFDLDPLVIGKALDDGNTILHGDGFWQKADTYDAVIVTGMTLANGTFWQIQDRCQQAGILIVMYAQTGGHLGPAMIELGVDLFIGECFPFYYEDGLSEAYVYVSRKHVSPLVQQP